MRPNPDMREATIGEKVWMPWSNDPGVVQAECTNVLGTWVCSTHKVAHANNLAANLHEDIPGEHVVYWMCHEHGPEAAK